MIADSAVAAVCDRRSALIERRYNLKQGWSGDLVEDQGRFPILFLVRWPDLGLIVRR